MGKVRMVVWTYDSFENNSKLKHCFTKYLKESCGLGYDQHSLFKYFCCILPLLKCHCMSFSHTISSS